MTPDIHADIIETKNDVKWIKGMFKAIGTACLAVVVAIGSWACSVNKSITALQKDATQCSSFQSKVAQRGQVDHRSCHYQGVSK